MTNFEIALITLSPMRAGDVRTFGPAEDPFKVKVRAVDTEGRADKAKRGPLCYSVEAQGLGGDAGMDVCQNLHLASACVVRALAAIRLDDDTARYPVGPWERTDNAAWPGRPEYHRRYKLSGRVAAIVWGDKLVLLADTEDGTPARHFLARNEDDARDRANREFPLEQP